MANEGTAYHEAAHCVLAYHFGLRPTAVTIEGELPRVIYDQPLDLLVTDLDDQAIKRWAIVLYAPYAALECLGVDGGLRSSADLEALSLLMGRLLDSGIGDQLPAMAREHVNKHWPEIQELARVVGLNGTVEGDRLSQELGRICDVSKTKGSP